MNDELLEKIERIRELASTRMTDIPGECYRADEKWSELSDILEALVRRTENKPERAKMYPVGVEQLERCKITIGGEFSVTQDIKDADRVELNSFPPKKELVVNDRRVWPPSECSEAHRLVMDYGKACARQENKNTAVGAWEQYHEEQRRLERAMCTYYDQHKDKP